MEIIEQIKTNQLIDNPTEIQKICLNKLQSNPLPNPKSELWRLSNRSKFSNFLDYSVNEKDPKFDTPYPYNSQNIIRLIIGEDSQISLIEENYSIQQLSDNKLDKYIKQKISCFDQNEHWSDLLNLSLSCPKNILGLKINGSKIPPIEIFSHASSNSLNAKTLVIFLEKNCNIELLQVNLGKENSSLSQSTFIYLEENSSLNHGVVSYGEDKSHLLNSLNVIQQKNSEYNLGSLHFKFNYARFEIRIEQSAGNAKTNIKGMQITKNNEQIATHTKIDFNGPNGFLDQINKSLADDKSHAIFDGSIIVPKIAQKTDASQLSRNLLLSNLAQIDTKPQLEIIADDVKCKHGATIAQLNDEELFYMRTRGITLKEASKLQLSSYFQEIISFIPISKDRWDLLDKLLNEN
ncbi:SufD family Fe-S cluster assembly protein [Prochlorococcus marinus]|uniref:SufD family Fe-S cluster assembly protein n=1 Tax=Prochlorococcus marinus TaxID=1219 RepID=UPI001ADA0E2E|nr:SufD family Fe-S cluster assembly protein [Prochlorococcus marinus]MBO8203634.1 SufD family Fe-S cluster assembly protein [Prochlorococcus marinus CUG1415]MBW3044791.1 ABC transporter permease [Prochlorococcus marinus str. MU1415]